MQSLDNNFNIRRIERFMVQLLEENINSVLVLNKADCDFDKRKVDEQMKHIVRQIPVFFTSIYQSQTILQLRESISVLIDTPGIREFGLAIDNSDSLIEALEISDYANMCRFRDCRHINEPGCAVLEAVNRGVLDHKIYESYLKLRREAWHFSASEHEKRRKDKSFAKLVEEVKKRKVNF